MKKNLLLLGLFALIFSFYAMSQCGQVSLIGEFNGWADDEFMVRDPVDPAIFSAFLSLNSADDTNGDAIVELKFRENADWTVNWGDVGFPSGTGTLNGPNIPVPVDTSTTSTTDYYVTFNCSTGEYFFQDVCGNIGVIGEFNGWADDVWMTRDESDLAMWSTVITFNASMDGNADGFIEAKFRQSADWGINWGGDLFPEDTGYQNGPNIFIPLDLTGTTTDYLVTFNCETGYYTFEATCGAIALIGEFNSWSADYAMIRDAADPNMWSVIFTLTPDMDGNADGFVETKFRENADWGVNWGGDLFPEDTGYQNGPNIFVPLDETGLTTDFYVTFDYTTGYYIFQTTVGDVSMIGEFNGWNGDIPMNRDAADPDLWIANVSLPSNFDFSVPPDGIIESKFRENNDWSVNWGNNTFPTGTGTSNGPNIPVVPGKYTVSFNSSTFDYNFTDNPDICGAIGMVGDFNGWGVGTGAVPTDVFLVRDAEYPCLFSIEYNFATTTGLLFRVDALPINNDNAWGGTSLCQTGVHDVTKIINVPGGKYNITFNALSGDYCFYQLGNSVQAPKVFAINVDGSLDENDWVITQPVAQVVDGTVGADLNEVYFGVAWNETYLYVGIDITDPTVTANEQGEVFVDGNKSGGAYDDSDVHLKFSAAGIEVIQGPSGITPELGFAVSVTGYTAEVAIPWADLGVTPAEGGQIGFDILIGDDDAGTGVEYTLAWNGGLQNYDNTSSFGDLLFGTLSCGCISVYNETIGDVILQNPTDMPTTYVGTYNMDNNFDVVFRKDLSGTVKWGSTDFPNGTGVLDGGPIPATEGRYRITFDCLSGAYTFAEEPADAGVAYAQRTETAPSIDGDLTEYNLDYTSDLVVVGTAENNNTVTWGALWDSHNLYLGVQVVDDVVEGSGNPWDNDAIEYYIDGNHDSDGAYDSDFDTQLIQDFLLNTPPVDTALWIKADGVAVTDFDAKWFPTANGYNCELRLGWNNFSFAPGKGRTIGFSMGNNDSDNGIGRDYQTVWYGTGNNWSNTGDLGDLQLAGGPYFGIFDIMYDNPKVLLYPNPSQGSVNLKLLDEVLGKEITVYVSDLSGRIVLSQSQNVFGTDVIQLNTRDLESGIYMVNVVGTDGRKAIEKLVIE
jgi:hypothetical protein